jgi:PAS domain S-box-containing protein
VHRDVTGEGIRMTLSPNSLPVIVMAGISLYLALHYLIIYARRPDYRVSLSFSMTCLAMGLYDFFAVALYNSPSPDRGLPWLRAQLATLASIAIVFLWFVAEYTGRVRRGWLYGFGAFFFLAALTEIVDRSELTWRTNEISIKHIPLPFGMQAIYQEVAPGPATTILSTGGVLLFLYVLALGIRLYRQGERQKALPMIAAMTVLFAGLLNDFAVLAGLYKFIYLIEYAYLAVMILMANTLAGEVVEAARLKEALQASEDRFRMLTESTSDWIWEIDENGRYRYASPKIRDLLGYEPSEVLGKSPFDFMPEEEVARVKRRFEEIAAARRPFVMLENTNLRKDGRIVVIETSGVPVFDAKGVFRGYRGIDRDVTVRKEAEEKIRRLNVELEQRVRERTKELERAYEDLKALDQAKDAFLSSVSHELRTPLTSIRSFSEILLNYDGIEPESQKEFISIINMESERLSRLINDVLDIAKIEAGKGVWNDTLVMLEKTIRQVALVQQPLLAEKNLTIALDLPQDLPPVHADPDRIQQVLMNLVGNAVNFSLEGGRITIRAEVLDRPHGRGAAGRWIKVAVSDQGIGIEEKDFEKIFEKFGQVVSDTLHDKPKGTGLGLPICRQIITHYGGDIWVESEKGRGSTFFFTLPAADLCQETRRQSGAETGPYPAAPAHP